MDQYCRPKMWLIFQLHVCMHTLIQMCVCVCVYVCVCVCVCAHVLDMLIFSACLCESTILRAQVGFIDDIFNYFDCALATIHCFLLSSKIKHFAVSIKTQFHSSSSSSFECPQSSGWLFWHWYRGISAKKKQQQKTKNKPRPTGEACELLTWKRQETWL